TALAARYLATEKRPTAARLALRPADSRRLRCSAVSSTRACFDFQRPTVVLRSTHFAAPNTRSATDSDRTASAPAACARAVDPRPSDCRGDTPADVRRLRSDRR